MARTVAAGLPPTSSASTVSRLIVRLVPSITRRRRRVTPLKEASPAFSAPVEARTPQAACPLPSASSSGRATPSVQRTAVPARQFSAL